MPATHRPPNIGALSSSTSGFGRDALIATAGHVSMIANCHNSAAQLDYLPDRRETKLG